VSGFPQPDDKPEVPKDKAVIVFSLPEVIFEFGELGEKQAFISNPFGITMSTNDRATMKLYAKALDPQGQGSDLGSAFLNKPCQLVVKHKEREGKPTVAVIDSVAAIHPSMQVPEADTEPFWFKWDEPDHQTLQMIPEFTQNLMKEAVNYEGSKVQALLEQADRIADGQSEETSF
jgi:hypothetical protein